MSTLSLRSYRGLGLSPRRRAAKGAAAPSIVQDGLIAEWRFDDGAGQVLTDYTGNGHHGQLGATSGADAADPTWTAQGLSFDGGDRVILPSLPAIQGVDIVFNSDVTINAPSGQRCLLSNIKDGTGTGIVFGSWTGSLTNEIISIGQDTAQGYSALHRRAWTHASQSVASGGWHLLQFDVRPAPNYYNLVLDGVDKANATVGTPQVWKAGIWSIADGVAGGGAGFAGDIAYVIFYSTARGDALQAQNRAALAAILAGRGITLP
jgi:hypothetical protein